VEKFYTKNKKMKNGVKMTHSHNKMIVLSIFMYQISFIIIHKFNEKLTKAKIIQILLVYCYIFILFLLPSFFLKKTPKITQCKIFAPTFFGVKKHFTLHHYTTQYFFKTPIFILHSVLCRCYFWKFLVYTGV
jgi:hypothetical protein